MKHVPKYLLPKIAPVTGTELSDEKIGFVPFRKDGRRGKGRGGAAGHRGKKKSDPLKKFGL